MIIGQFESQATYDQLDKQRGQLANYDYLPPAKFFLLLRLRGPEPSENPKLEAILYSNQVRVKSLNPWLEETRLVLASTFSRFTSIFHAEETRNIRIKFIAPHPTLSGEDEDIMYLDTKLEDVLNADSERLQITPISYDEDNPVPTDMVAELGVKWLQFADDKMVIEFTVNVDKTTGWPFPTARPFGALYVWNIGKRKWEYIYHSEQTGEGIATQGSKQVHHKGFVELALKKLIGQDRTLPLRLEFFHHQPGLQPHVLGLYTTSLQRLRQEEIEAPLKMGLGAFSQGELVGELKMVRSKMKTGRLIFSLQADFGGHPKGPCVYFDFELFESEDFLHEGRRVDGPSCFVIESIIGPRKWARVYQSEESSDLFGRNSSQEMHKFKIAKLSHKRLCEEDNQKRIRFRWFHYLDGDRFELGAVETTMEELLSMEPNTQLPFTGSKRASNGHIMFKNIEKDDQRTLFLANCIVSTQNKSGIPCRRKPPVDR